MLNLSYEPLSGDTTKSSTEESLDETSKDNNDGQTSKWIKERKFLVCLLDHINNYERDFSLSRYNFKFLVDNSVERINLLKTKIEKNSEIYMINDWNEAKDNREKVINLISLLSEGTSSIPLGNSGKCEVIKSAITTNCWEQMDKTSAIAETIPNIQKTWVAPILAILSKFPYYESSELKIILKHYQKLYWSFGGPFSITRHINPLRNNILNDFLIPEDKKLEDFFLVMKKRTYSVKSNFSQYEKLRDLLYLNLTNSIFINDDQWNSHIITFISEDTVRNYARETDFEIF